MSLVPSSRTQRKQGSAGVSGDLGQVSLTHMFKTGRDRQRVQLRKRTGGPLSFPEEELASAGALGRHSVLATPQFRPGSLRWWRWWRSGKPTISGKHHPSVTPAVGMLILNPTKKGPIPGRIPFSIPNYSMHQCPQ